MPGKRNPKPVSRADRLRDPKRPLAGWPTLEDVQAHKAPTNNRLLEMQQAKAVAEARSVQEVVASINRIGERAQTKHKAWLSTLEMLERTAKKAAPEHLPQAQELIRLIQKNQLTVAEWGKLRAEAEQLFQNLKPHIIRK